MNKFTKGILVSTLFIMGSASIATASLSVDQDAVYTRTTTANVKALLDQMPVSNTASSTLADLGTSIDNLNGTSAEHVTTVRLNATATTTVNSKFAAGGAAAVDEFLDGTASVGSVVTSQLSVDSLTDYRVQLALLFDRLTVGITVAGGALATSASTVRIDGSDDQAAITAATTSLTNSGATTRDNVKLKDIVLALYAVALNT